MNFRRPQAFYAQGRLKTGQMNSGEKRYAEHLEREKHAGRVLWWKFEGIKLRLADNTFYTPLRDSRRTFFVRTISAASPSPCMRSSTSMPVTSILQSSGHSFGSFN